MKRFTLTVTTVLFCFVVSAAADLDQRVKLEYADSGGLGTHASSVHVPRYPVIFTVRRLEGLHAGSERTQATKIPLEEK